MGCEGTEEVRQQRNKKYTHNAADTTEASLVSRLLHLSPEGAALSELSLTTSRLAQDSGARCAEDDSGGVREDGGDLEAARALDVHEERVGRLDETLQLVLTGLVLSGRVQQVVRDRHGEKRERRRGRKRLAERLTVLMCAAAYENQRESES